MDHSTAGGLLLADRGPSDDLEGKGVTGYVRVGNQIRRSLALGLEAWLTHVGKTDAIFDCFSRVCGSLPYLGPPTVLSSRRWSNSERDRAPRTCAITLAPL